MNSSNLFLIKKKPPPQVPHRSEQKNRVKGGGRYRTVLDLRRYLDLPPSFTPKLAGLEVMSYSNENR